MSLDPIAVEVFASKGLQLTDSHKEGYSWAIQNPFLIGETIKDLQVIVRDNQSWETKKEVVIPMVRFEDRNLVAQQVLDEFMDDIRRQESASCEAEIPACR